MRILYCPLEEYDSRYSLQLRKWNIDEFENLGVEYKVIEGTLHKAFGDKAIKTGQVLDAHNRTYYAMSQIQKLIELAYVGQLDSDDFILFEDMFHPGIESLFYVFQQQSLLFGRPKIGMRCLAQTIDPDDFVHYTGMAKWMRQYESMVNSFVDVIFAASTEMLGYMLAAGWNVPVLVTGLPFGKKEVLHRLTFGKTEVIPFWQRPRKVVFASRMAYEKQPEFYFAVAREYKKIYPLKAAEFAIVSGTKIKGFRIDKQVIDGNVTVYPDLTKEQYYQHLNTSRVLFNCSLQDWVSNTASEADTLGCNLCFAAYRSFPEAFENRREQMYIPWSVEDAVEKIALLIENPCHQGLFSDKQNETISKTVGVIKTIIEGAQLKRLTDYIGDSRYHITFDAIKDYR